MRFKLTILILLASLWLTACGTTAPFSASEFCLPAADSTARLKVQYDGQVKYFLLRTEKNAEQVVFVALDTIGSPQFTATLIAGELGVERSPLYRGIDPAILLWGFNWWSLRTKPLAACAEAAGLQLHQTAVSISLSHNGRPSWRWNLAQPQQFDLPQQGGSVNVMPQER